MAAAATGFAAPGNSQVKNTTQELSIRWMRLEKAAPDDLPRLVGFEDAGGEAERD